MVYVRLSCLSSPFFASLSFSPSFSTSCSNSPFFAPLLTSSFFPSPPHISLSLLSPSPSSLLPLSLSPLPPLSLSLFPPPPSSLSFPSSPSSPSSLPQSSGESNSSSYSHQQVLQLIKSRSKEQRLGILLAGQNRKDHNFINMQVYTRVYRYIGSLIPKHFTTYPLLLASEQANQVVSMG